MNGRSIATNVGWKAVWPQAASVTAQPAKTAGIRTILVPTDFSGYSDMALGLAIDLARQQGAKIYLLHILRHRDPADASDEMRKQIARFPAPDVEIIPDIREGRICDGILDIEAEVNPELIIMSRHRQGDSLMSLFRGITAKIRRKAHSSVLVVGA